MNAREMHYDFKQKLNVLDSQKNRNLIVPEIDWKLNEAQEVFCKMVAQPRFTSQLGFEINQRTVADIRTIVINQTKETGIVPVVYDNSSYIVTLPSDFWFYVNSKVYVNKGTCLDIKLSTREIQHDDEHELSPFDRSSFLWRVSNIRFNKDGIRIFTDGSYQVTKICLDYLKKPRRIHNAQDWEGGTYNTLDGITLTGSQSCELPETVHREIVDLAVLIAAGDLGLSSFPFKQNKIKLIE